MKAKEIIKRAYSIFPYKKEIFTLLKRITPVHPNLYRHLYFKGIFVVPVENKTFKMKHYGFEIENEVFWRGLENGWERVSMSLWIKLCKDADVIVDIGANTGVYALVAQALQPHAKVIALEPVERIFKKLKENVQLNGFNVQCLQVAASNFNGTAKIYDTADEHIYSVTVNVNFNQPDKTVTETEISTITLDTLTSQLTLPKIDLIKIDVETHEAEVLEGYRENIHLHSPTLLIEILNETVAERVNELLKGMNYLYFNIDETKGIRQTEKIAKSDYYNYLVCSPLIAKRLKLVF